MTLDLVVRQAVKEAVREALAELREQGSLSVGDDQPLTYAQGAEYASLSTETISEWVCKGILPATGKGHTRRVTRAGIRLALQRVAEKTKPVKTAPSERANAIVRSIR